MNFQEYPKIETLFKRGPTFVVDPSRIKKPVLATISEWDVTEKIDGMNIRVGLSTQGDVTFGGRTDAAKIPGDLVDYLNKTFPMNWMKQALWIDQTPPEFVLYGEGYGAGIQKVGKSYRADKAFILFDVLVGGKWWLGDADVREIGGKLGVEVVPYLGRMSLGEIVELVRKPFPSRIGTAEAEGVVARPIETLFNKRGDRVIIKLKTRDFNV